MAQNLEFIDSIPINGTDFAVDKLGNIYGFENEEIWKYSTTGDSIFYNSNKMLGKVESIDLTLSMRPLVFYKNSNQVVLYDNTLSEQTETNINLEELSWQQVTLVAASFNNNQLWLYDNANSEVLQVDRQLNILQRSGNLKQTAGIENLNPSEMFESGNKLYLVDSTLGALVFDLYGTYYTTAHLENASNLTVNSILFMYTSENKMHLYNSLSLEETIYDFPLKNVKKCLIVNDTIYFSKNGKVFSYLIQLEE